MAANSLKANNSWLGDYFRRMKSKGGHNYLVGTEAFHIVEGRYEAADGLVPRRRSATGRQGKDRIPQCRKAVRHKGLRSQR